MRSAPASRAPATSGPKTKHVAAAAGSERADGPTPHPHPRYASIRALHRTGVWVSTSAARTNGALSNNVAADVTSSAVTTLLHHALRIGCLDDRGYWGPLTVTFPDVVQTPATVGELPTNQEVESNPICTEGEPVRLMPGNACTCPVMPPSSVSI